MLHVFPFKCYKVAYERQDPINYELQLSTATASDLVVQVFKRFFSNILFSFAYLSLISLNLYILRLIIQNIFIYLYDIYLIKYFANTLYVT